MKPEHLQNIINRIKAEELDAATKINECDETYKTSNDPNSYYRGLIYAGMSAGLCVALKIIESELKRIEYEKTL